MRREENNFGSEVQTISTLLPEKFALKRIMKKTEKRNKERETEKKRESQRERVRMSERIKDMMMKKNVKIRLLIFLSARVFFSHFTSMVSFSCLLCLPVTNCEDNFWWLIKGDFMLGWKNNYFLLFSREKQWRKISML